MALGQRRASVRYLALRDVRTFLLCFNGTSRKDKPSTPAQDETSIRKAADSSRRFCKGLRTIDHGRNPTSTDTPVAHCSNNSGMDSRVNLRFPAVADDFPVAHGSNSGATNSRAKFRFPSDKCREPTTRVRLGRVLHASVGRRRRWPFMCHHRAKSLGNTVAYCTSQAGKVQLILEYRSLGQPLKLEIVNLELVDSKRGPSTGGGDIDAYLDNFCVWQCNRNQLAAKQGLGRWDHALMLSGLDLVKGNNSRVLGLAWVNGMCRCRYSCTLSEARSLEAALVVAHELGHSLGMHHDGPPDNRCDPDSFIMSAKTGAGKTRWSACSGQYLEDFLSSRTSSCLASRTSQPVAELDGEPLPGQLFPDDAQCKLALGTDYSAYTSSRSPFNNVCRELWCLKGSWASPAHPALDGTTCAKGKYCREGSCVVRPAAQQGGSPAASTKRAPRSTVVTTTTNPTTSTRRSVVNVVFPDISRIWNNWFRRGFPSWF